MSRLNFLKCFTKRGQAPFGAALAAIFILTLSAISFSEEDAQVQTKILVKSENCSAIRTKIIKEVPLPKGYHEGLFYDGRSIWVANGKGGMIWVVDTSLGAVVSEIKPIAGFTEGITKTSAGNYFVTDWDAEKIYRARVENNGLVAENELSLAPAHPTGVMWNGKRLFVIIWTRGLGTKFDIVEMDEDLNVLGKVRINRIHEPAHLAWDGKNLWITSWFSRMVYKVDIDRWEIVGYFSSPVPKATGITWDGKYLWLTGTYGSLFQIEVMEN